MTRKELQMMRVRTLNTAEKKTILSRLFPDGYIVRKDEDEDNENTIVAGYTEDGHLIEVMFTLYDSRIEVDYKLPYNCKNKWEYISNLVNKMLGKQNPHAKLQAKYAYDKESYYLVMTINPHRFFIAFNINNNLNIAV